MSARGRLQTMVMSCENRACPECVRTRSRCDLGIRPCRSCLSIDSENVLRECILDAAVLVRACKECRDMRRSCDKKRPCTRCAKRNLKCLPYISNPKSKKSESSLGSAVQIVDSVHEVLSHYLRPAVGGLMAAAGEVEDNSSTSGVSTTTSVQESSQGSDSLLMQIRRSIGSSVQLQLFRLLQEPQIYVHYVLSEPPAFWDTPATFEFARNMIMDMSPLVLYDSVTAVGMQKISFFFMSICQFLPPAIASTLFHLVFQILEESFPQMNPLARSILESKLRSFSLQMLVTKTALERSFRPNEVPKSENETPIFTELELLAIDGFVSSFQSKWLEKYPLIPADLPGVVVHKMDYSSGQMQLFCNEKMAQLVGNSLADHLDVLHKREVRDRSWISTSTTTADRLVTGVFCTITKDSLKEFVKMIFQCFLRNETSVTGYITQRDRSGQPVVLYYLSSLVFAPETELFDMMVFVGNPIPQQPSSPDE
eukprot:TRINITY_DN6637_c0_g1_i1.p1 TRINITY_DN6637_c0_g1~~TRINITY_DN6637_c0_g1_i1.p1  ORF type:complete len:489 (+),score=87.26 TRINITY_DN6637_c0_g1_i1:24-1469(+)